MKSAVSALFGEGFARQVLSGRVPRAPKLVHGDLVRLRIPAARGVADADLRARQRWVGDLARALARDWGGSLLAPEPRIAFEECAAEAAPREDTVFAERVIVQLAGRGRWSLGDSGRGARRAWVLRPGSVLFLPRGTPAFRQALSSGKVLSFGLVVPTWLDVVLDRVSHTLVQDPVWRDSVPPWFAERRSEAEQRLATLLAKLPASNALGPFDARELVAFEGARRQAFDANLRGGAHLFAIAPGARLRRLASESWLFVTRSRRLEMDVEPTSVPLVSWIARQTRPFSLTEALRHGEPLSHDETIQLLELLAHKDVLCIQKRGRKGA